MSTSSNPGLRLAVPIGELTKLVRHAETHLANESNEILSAVTKTLDEGHAPDSKRPVKRMPKAARKQGAAKKPSKQSASNGNSEVVIDVHQLEGLVASFTTNLLQRDLKNT